MRCFLTKGDVEIFLKRANMVNPSNVATQKPTGFSYLQDGIGFSSQKALFLRTIYFPLCGVDADGIKSSITPYLSGDIKIDKNRYLTKPVSTEDLRQNVRNFFCYAEGKGVVSLGDHTGQDDAAVEAGMLWHKLKRFYPKMGLAMEAFSFVPISGQDVELMRVTLHNLSDTPLRVTPTFSLPIFGRSLSNKHDHEHVTSLLHRIDQLPHGVCVEPTMAFDERGHQPNTTVYYVLGVDQDGNPPQGTFPTAAHFLGEGGDVFAPEAVMDNRPAVKLSQEAVQGQEAMGALRFKDEELGPGAVKEYLVVMGVGSDREEMFDAFHQFNTPEKFNLALEQNQVYWSDKSRAIQLTTGDEAFNAWMRWVTLQPVFRRIFGCSFLPDHDYGKGGKGWRDIWQDLLSLILIEPENIREVLINNFAGVRIDGSNATIIGSAPGEFVADRDAIVRVWMDHGVWPFTTVLLYINQTGDYDILFEENTYFRDAQLSRAFQRDYSWKPKDGNVLKNKNGRPYTGSIIEHILNQHLVQFFNVGEHNITRLEDADWNDGLDMARERGESVAFMSFYGGNLLALADLLENLSQAQGVKEISLGKEIEILLDSLTGISVDYDDPEAKKEFLFKTYFASVQPMISGEKINISVKRVAADLRKKGDWIFNYIRVNERVTVEQEGHTDSWFNGYYDNQGRRVEGAKEDRIRMTLAGQVFPVMSGLADRGDIQSIVRAVQRYLQDKKLGGVRLNTDFGLPYYMDLGRAFGFAYGTKENGAFFSHMTVMYAYALYSRGFVREGYDVLRSIYSMCVDERSKIYPGIPEYFDSQGRGRYHYLTGSASWLVLTQLTQVFGVRGEGGDLLLAPQLVKEEFDVRTGQAVAVCHFAGKRVIVTYQNSQHLDYGAYAITEVYLNGEAIDIHSDKPKTVKVQRVLIENSPLDCTIRVVLEAV
jgi:cellobiose phosphorylase